MDEQLQNKVPETLQDFYVDLLLAGGLAVEGTHGGLVLEPSHEQGGIKMLKWSPEGYFLCGEMEGGEYILNPGATAYYPKTISEINDAKRDSSAFEETSVDYNGHIIDCQLAEYQAQIHGMVAKIIVFKSTTSPFIINKYSTIKHLEKLTLMNLGISFRYNNVDMGLATQFEAIRTDTSEVMATYKFI